MTRAIFFISASFVVMFVAQIALAQTTIVISDPQTRFPIAVPRLCLESGNTPAHQDIPKIVARDLELSGYFDVLNPNSYVESASKCLKPDAREYQDWSMIHAQWLVRGVVSGFGQSLRVQLFLHDVPNQRPVLGKEYQGDNNDIPRIAHRFANEIMKYVTGEYGPFGSKIAFSGKIGRFKDLFIMDMDGSNVRQLTNDRTLVLSPSWNRTGTSILYEAFKSRIPDIFILDPVSGRSKQLTRSDSLEIGGTFTPDGGSIVTSIASDRGSQLTAVDLSGKIIRKLTSSTSTIDVSPSFSPDGRAIAFCSDRAGLPQIYVMGADGSNPRRISFVSSNFCTSPVWSPKGDRIAFVCRAEGGFNLFLSNVDGSNPIQLTSGGKNEDPSWSPDGRYLAFASTGGGRGGYNISMIRVAKNLEGTALNQLTNSRSDNSEPDWGPLPVQ